jgi:transcription initiation factor TFIID TATA-box-binding protein
MDAGIDIDADNTVTIDSTSDLYRYRVEHRPSPVIIKNCVATAFFGCRLDLKEIAWRCHAEFDPRSFAAAKLRLMNPQSTALLFASGKIVCTGAPSEASACVAVTQIFKMVSAIMQPGLTSLLDVKIENIVGTAHLGYGISLRRAYEWMRSSGDVTVMYSAELFPGMRFQIKRWAQQFMKQNQLTGCVPHTKILAFQDGNVVITGGKTRDDLLNSWKTLRALLVSFEVNDKVRLTTLCIFMLGLICSSAGSRRTKIADMRSQKSSTSVIVLAMITALAWLWIVSKLGIEWNANVANQKRRMQEATWTVEICKQDTTHLSKEFTLCDKAHMMIADDSRVSVLTAFEHTVRVVAGQVIDDITSLSLQAIINVSVIACASGLLAYITNYFRSVDEVDVLSPVRRARLLGAQDSVDFNIKKFA